MPTDTALGSDLRTALDAIERADVVAGIPSYNNAGTIAHVVSAVRDGLRTSFPGARCVVVNSDGGSRDGTPDVAREADTEELRVIAGPYEGPPGKGSALRAVFEAVTRLGARAACVLDSDLRSVTPEWVARLARPISEGRADYVTPLYVRHKHDGTITNNVVYPLVRSLYGYRVRQPIGGEFGFSGELAAQFLAEDVWESDVARFGVDIFMTTTALASGARVRQAALGAKIHDAKDPASHLGPMFSQVLGSAIRQVGRHRDRWASGPSRPVPIEGEMAPIEPDDVRVDLAKLDAAVTQGGADDRARWEAILGEEDLARLLAGARERRPADQDLERAWARALYDVFAASLRDPAGTDANVRALLPLYFARVAMHVRAAERMRSAEAESLVERQAQAFEAERPRLAKRLAA